MSIADRDVLGQALQGRIPVSLLFALLGLARSSFYEFRLQGFMFLKPSPAFFFVGSASFAALLVVFRSWK